MLDWRRIVLETALLAMIGALAIVDNLSGPELALSIFYLVPVALAAWFLPRPLAWGNAVLGGAASFTADVLIGHRLDPTIAAVNLAFRFLLFGFVLELVSRLGREFVERKRLIVELQAALAEVRTLSDLLPMCAWCGQVRDDAGYWQKLEAYLHDRTGTAVSHGICPSCAAKLEAGPSA